MDILKSRYQIKNLLREDIISELYHGLDRQTGDTILVCKFKKEYLSQPIIKQLIEQSESLLRIENQTILTLLDYAFDGVYFYAIYEGSLSFITLEEYLLSHNWDSASLWKLSTQILSGCVALENDGLFHGSLSLNTILVTEDGQVKLIKSMFQALILKRNIQSMDVVDDCICVAPEVFNRQALSSHTDMYSFGVILFFLFSKSWPFPYTLSVNKHKAALILGPKRFEKHDDKVPDKLSAVISTCLQLSDKDRFPTFIELIKTYKGEYSLELPKSYSPSVAKSLKSELKQQKAKKNVSRLVYGLLVGLVACLMGISYYLYSLYITAIPEKIVPNVVGLDKQEALELLQQHRLKGIVAGERIHPLYPQGIVIESKPRAGREVKQNRMIRLYFSKGQGAELVPDLIGRSKGQAEGLLFDRKIEAEVVNEVYSIEYPEGVIVAQSPTPNSLILPSENIQLTISKGFPVSISVSKLKSSFFKNKDHLRQVNISFSVLPDWEEQEVTIMYASNNKNERIYSDVHQPNESVDLDFELDYGGEISVYFNEVNAFSQRILDE